MVETPISIDVVNIIDSYIDANEKKGHILEELWAKHDTFNTKIYATRAQQIKINSLHPLETRVTPTKIRAIPTQFVRFTGSFRNILAKSVVQM